jgi:hypothetical protein
MNVPAENVRCQLSASGFPPTRAETVSVARFETLM